MTGRDCALDHAIVCNRLLGLVRARGPDKRPGTAAGESTGDAGRRTQTTRSAARPSTEGSHSARGSPACGGRPGWRATQSWTDGCGSDEGAGERRGSARRGWSRAEATGAHKAARACEHRSSTAGPAFASRYGATVALRERGAVRGRMCARRPEPERAPDRAAPRRTAGMTTVAVVALVVRRRVSAIVSRI
jgi:hypothetical protein